MVVVCSFLTSKTDQNYKFLQVETSWILIELIHVCHTKKEDWAGKISMFYYYYLKNI